MGSMTKSRYCKLPLNDMPVLTFCIDKSRRFFKASHLNPHRALQQLEEATRFREEQHVLHLYMTIHVDDFEDTRRYVSPALYRSCYCRLTGLYISITIGLAAETNVDYKS